MSWRFAITFHKCMSTYDWHSMRSWSTSSSPKSFVTICVERLCVCLLTTPKGLELSYNVYDVYVSLVYFRSDRMWLTRSECNTELCMSIRQRIQSVRLSFDDSIGDLKLLPFNKRIKYIIRDIIHIMKSSRWNHHLWCVLIWIWRNNAT